MHCWGWASWKESWSNFNTDSALLYKTLKSSNLLGKFDQNTNGFFVNQLRKNILGKSNTWAIRWFASIFLHNGVCIMPSISLVRNIGNDGSGSNTKSGDIFDSELLLSQPTYNRQDIFINSLLDSRISKHYRTVYFLPNRILRLIKRILNF